MLSILLHSDFGDAAFLARRFQREGHRVKLWIRDEASRQMNDGLVDKARGPEVPFGTDLVIFDGVGHGHLGQQLRNRGIPVIGANPLDHDLEIDRMGGIRLMKAAGIAVPETKAFRSLKQARAFLATHPGEFFVKPSGNKDTDLTANGDEDYLSRMLRWAEAEELGDFRDFVIQKAVEGTEVSCQGWFDGKKWVPPFDSTLETKKLLTGDLGPRVGCAANVCWAWDSPELAEQTVRRLEPTLRAAKYVGPIDLNMLLVDGEPHGIEWSARLGFDAMQAWSMLHGGNLGLAMYRFARGELPQWQLRKDQLAVTLRLSIPPYPTPALALAKKKKGFPLDEQLWDDPDHTFLDDVMKGPDGTPVLSGRDGSIGCLGAVGTDYAKLEASLLDRAEDLKIRGLQYRTDVVPDARERWNALAEMGYLTDADAPPKEDAMMQMRRPKIPSRPSPPGLRLRRAFVGRGRRLPMEEETGPSIAAGNEAAASAPGNPPHAPFVVDVPPGT